MSALAIARVNFVLMIRDRSNLITMVTLPLLFVFLIGSQFGGEQTPTVVVERTGSASDEVATLLDENGAVEGQRADTTDEARDAIGAGEAALGVVVPADIRDRVLAGDTAEVGMITSPDGNSADLRPLVVDAVGEVTLVPSATAALVESSNDAAGSIARDDIASAVDSAAGGLERVSVEVADDQGAGIDPATRFDESAAQQLVLMVFLFTLFSAVPMAHTRMLGVMHRMTVSPTSIRSIVLGEALGRWVVAVAQGAYIIAGSAVIFGVEWGPLAPTVVVLAAFGAVGAGAGMLLGGLLDNEGLIVGVGSILGLAIAAIGGAMVPRELFSSTLETIARFTPHSWALDALTELREGGELAGIVPDLAVLLAAAAVLVGLASWRLRVVLRSS